MKKLAHSIIAILLTGWAASASAVPLLTIDIADLNAVTISATGASPVADGDPLVTSFEGISLLGILSAPAFDSVVATGDLVPNGGFAPYDTVQDSFSGLDLDIFCAFCFDFQDFLVGLPAFTGSLVADLSGFSLLGAGSTGDIAENDTLVNFPSVLPIVGQWEIIDSSFQGNVPEPGTLGILGLGLLGLAATRRKSFGITN